MSFKDLYDTTRAKLVEGTAKNPIEVSVAAAAAEGFRCVVKIRDFELVIDQPKGFGGGNSGPKPSEVLLAALAACQQITWRLYADALGVPLNGVRVEIGGRQDLRGFLGTAEGVRAGFQDITATVIVDSPASDEEIARLKSVVDSHCPVLDDLASPVPVSLEWRRETA
jgi:Predicted redox protein, regulator of disulfide bond formation